MAGPIVPHLQGDAPDLQKGKFVVNYPKYIAELASAMRKFPVKKILYSMIFRGKGLEFDSYREFASDDDASMIDWKASLRANSMLAKKYIEERDLNVYFLVDVSNSMLFGSSDKLKSEFVAELVASLAHLTMIAGDRIGLVMFSDDVVKVLQPSSGRNQFALFTKLLSDSNLYGGGFDLDKAVDHVLKMSHNPYTVFIIVSDFIKTKKSSERSLKLMGSRFETIAVMVRDELDENLPKTKYQFAIQDPYSGKQMILDPEVSGERYHHNAVRQKKMLREVLKKSRIDLFDLKTDVSFVQPLAGFLKNRARSGGGRI